MHNELSILINRLSNPGLANGNIIKWGCPIPSFGNVSIAKIATVGLNPSNLEFVDSDGNELEGAKRRFPTLKSLGLLNWENASDKHLEAIKSACYEYFARNPYDEWFKQLDRLLSDTRMSYYFPNGQVCHLDLIPYSTTCKWSELAQKQRQLLLDATKDILGLLIEKSSISLLILNGQTVIDNFQKITNNIFEKKIMNDWTLPRKETVGVVGYSYEGTVNSIGNIALDRDIHVLGYNHNIQSSLGVTTQVRSAIKKWISEKAQNIFNEAYR